jgi:hypothetical protein
MRLSHFCILLAAILMIAVGVGCGNNKVAEVPSAVASVNGEKITSSEYLTWLSDIRGRDALKAIIEGKILTQWAKDEGVAVTDDQVNKQIADMKRVGQYDQAVKQAGESMLKYQLQVAQARVNLAKKFYGKTVTDKQLQELYDGMNKQSEMFVHSAGKQVELMGDKDQQKMQDALSELKAGKPMAEVAAKNTDPKFGGENTVTFWAGEKQKGMPKPLQDAINATKVGEYGDVVGIGAEGKPVSQYVVFKVLSERPKDNISFSDAKEQILGAVLLQKTQSDPDFETRFTTKKKAAKIDIEIKRFEDVKYGFMYPPPPQP